MAPSNRARSRVRPSRCSLVLIDHTWLGLRGGFAGRQAARMYRRCKPRANPERYRSLATFIPQLRPLSWDKSTGQCASKTENWTCS